LPRPARTVKESVAKLACDGKRRLVIAPRLLHLALFAVEIGEKVEGAAFRTPVTQLAGGDQRRFEVGPRLFHPTLIEEYGAEARIFRD
jgi:hypothetical protein